MTTTPVLRLLPSDFPQCRCGHLRLEHRDESTGTGRCARDCGCRLFEAKTHEDQEN